MGKTVMVAPAVVLFLRKGGHKQIEIAYVLERKIWKGGSTFLKEALKG